MALSVEDVRVHNTDPQGRRITFSVARPEATASPSLRRSIRHTPFAIDRGSSVDMCKALRCDPEQAAHWLKASPDVVRWVAVGALRIGPPPAPAPAQTPPEPAAPPEPPAPPEPEKVLLAVPIPNMPGRSQGVWVSPEQLAEIEAGLRTVDGTDAPPPGAPPPAIEGAGAPESSNPEESEDDAEAAASEGHPAGGADDGQPSAAWTRERLEIFAQMRGIDCTGKSKSWILREIRNGGRR